MHSINGGTLKSSILIICLNHTPSIFGVSKFLFFVAPIMKSVRDGVQYDTTIIYVPQMA